MYKINFIYFCKYVDTISPNNKFNNTINFFIKFCFTSLTHIHNMTSDYTSGKVVTAKFATQLPIGCSEYIIALGSSSNTQAFYYGKIKNKTV